MQFNNHATGEDIISDITFLTGVGLSAYPLSDRTRNVNSRYRQAWTTIRAAYAGWLFMDSNVSDTSTGIPYADQTLTSGTELYALPSDALTINEVSVLNSGGTRELLVPITYEQFTQMGGDSSFTSNASPRYYLLQGDVIRIKPTPNYTQASTGLRIYFDPKISAFVTTDTTKVPGLDETFHRMLSVGAALDYAIVKGLEKRNELQNMWNDYEVRLRETYSSRWKNRLPHRISPGHDLMREFT